MYQERFCTIVHETVTDIICNNSALLYSELIVHSVENTQKENTICRMP